MSETLQQFCQRIMPVVQAGAEGKEIEFLSKLTDEWQTKIAGGFDSIHEYRVAKPKATPLPITPEMWAMIDPKYKWAVMSKGGNIVLIAGEKPINNGGYWVLNNSEYCQSPLAIDTTGIVPELSMTERPNDGGKATNHDDCQLLVVSSRGAKSPLQTALDEKCCCGVPDRLFKFL